MVEIVPTLCALPRFPMIACQYYSGLKACTFLQERRKLYAPVLSEKDLVALVASLLPVGEDHAVQLESNLFESLQVITFHCCKGTKLDLNQSALKCHNLGLSIFELYKVLKIIQGINFKGRA